MINQTLLLAGDDAYNLSKSLRFRSSASAYLNRTPASAGNRKTWTWSGWVKRGALSATYSMFSAYPSDGFTIRFQSDDTLRIYDYVSSYNIELKTTQVFRDPSAWYHIVFAIDTTQATSSNRCKLYVNGVQVTSFTTSTYPTQNSDLLVNSTTAHFIGKDAWTSNYLDGYLTEVNFIDGQALTPSSFGSTNSQTGVWQPKKFGGAYGTNGFYLPFTDVATTSGSNAGLGKDFSGNGNYWTTNNISVTAGTTYDSMKDVPTLTDADTANYCVANPLAILGNSNVTIAGGNLDVTIGVGGGWRSTPASTFAIPSTGKWYFEVTQNNATSGGNCAIGILQSGVTYTGNYYFYTNAYGFAYINDGTKGNNNSTSAYGSSWTSAGDNIGVAIDMSAGTLTFYKNNVSQGSAYTFDTTREYFVMLAGASSVPQYSINYGQRPFSYTPPTGFKALNTYNLPTPTIGATTSTLASKNFDATTYTGNGSTQTITNSGSMQPDLVWVKSRSNAYNNVINDSIRGSTKLLITNGTDAEQTEAQSITSFNSNGFSLGTAGTWNQNGSTFVAWQWKANGSAVSNTAGSITSQVSANASAGFSIVVYTGNGSTATIGHGLGVAPKLIFVKNKSSTQPWTVYYNFDGLGAGVNYLCLNSTATNTYDPNVWNSAVATSSTFPVGNSLLSNGAGGDYVAYCFADIAGYSKIGKYTGNGSADGTFVHLGFRPKFLMWKRSDSTGDWIIFDTARDTFNYAEKQLVANTSGAEAVTGGGFVRIDMLSNGFKIRSTDSYVNANGGTYIFMAVAENPFKNSLAR